MTQDSAPVEAPLREWSFDGLVGPTHNYAGLSPGNLASTAHRGDVSNPKLAALQGLAKMRFVAGLGVPQAVLPPQPRPDVDALRRLGFVGSDAQVVERAARDGGHLLRLTSSASSMWTANAATVAPSPDTQDGLTHVTAANLAFLLHRSLEAPTTERVLRAIFADPERFQVHAPLPSTPQLCDEGAANHTRLETRTGVAHLFGWGRRAYAAGPVAATPGVHPARQTLEASQAVARANRLRDGLLLTWQQSPLGIDAGAFHTDVLAVGTGSLLLVHELAFVRLPELLGELRRRLGSELMVVVASSAELPASNAVRAYPFNSQLLSLDDETMTIVAPTESRDDAPSREFLERVVSDAGNPVASVHYLDVNASMNNGGGPACLRLRVPLTRDEEAAMAPGVQWSATLDRRLTEWVETHYRDRLAPSDLADPALLGEGRCALDELTMILGLGSVYDFQRSP